MKLGEKAVTDEQLNQIKEEAEQEKIEREKNPEKFYNDSKEFYYKELLKIKDYINTIDVAFDKNLITTNGTSAENIIIDGEGYYVISKQIAQKVSDYEYKVYQMYFLTENEIGDKTYFNITVKINSIGSIVDLSNWKPKTKDVILVHGPDGAREIEFNGEFTVNVSKNKALENTKKIIPDCDVATYKDMTKKVEEVKVTPLQIIAKVSTRIDNLSLQKLSSTMNKDYIGITNFDVYDNTGEKLISSNYEVRRTVTYSNGKVEEWSPGDIGTYKSFYNATMELTEYIIIEKKENVDSIKIVSTVEEPTRDDDGNYTEREVEFGQFDIDLR